MYMTEGEREAGLNAQAVDAFDNALINEGEDKDGLDARKAVAEMAAYYADTFGVSLEDFKAVLRYYRISN